MQWDLGLQGIAYLAAMSLGFGAVAWVFVSGDQRTRLWAGALNALACFAVGLLTSEVLFGWATEEDLQPNIDGLSRDEALISGILTTALVVAVLRYVSRHAGHAHGRHVGHG